ncbi:hypothetical protein CRUP_032907 [Coryphaenoides rupestris]|nr:hypothetical protein CRUP_032907 [Coryphaenoides rupestris]
MVPLGSTKEEEEEEEVVAVVERPRVVNVILPEQRGHMAQQLGYVIATFFLLALIMAATVVLTRRRRKRDYKNNLLKARDLSKGCNNDLERKMWL